MSATSSGRFSIIPTRALDDSRLTYGDIVVLTMLGSYSDRSGRCWPSNRVMAKRLGTTRQAVIRRIKKLESLGYVMVEMRQTPHGGSTTNVYRIVFDADVVAEFDRAEGEDTPVTILDTPPVSNLATAPVSVLVTHNKEERTHKNVTDIERQFSEFQAAYPSRASAELSDPPKPAREKFLALIRKGTDPETLIRGAKHYAAVIANTRTEPRFVPQMAKWLNNEMWTQYQNRPAPKRSAVGMC